ncbi:hypothetical protein NHX12_026719, partial [Muraenolepis orangiensis]
ERGKPPEDHGGRSEGYSFSSGCRLEDAALDRDPEPGGELGSRSETLVKRTVM